MFPYNSAQVLRLKQLYHAHNLTEVYFCVAHEDGAVQTKDLLWAIHTARGMPAEKILLSDSQYAALIEKVKAENTSTISMSTWLRILEELSIGVRMTNITGPSSLESNLSSGEGKLPKLSSTPFQPPPKSDIDLKEIVAKMTAGAPVIGDGVEIYQYSPGWGLPSIDPDCISLLTFAKMAKVKYTLVNCNNEYMSPSQSLPFLRLPNERLLSGMAPMLDHLKRKGMDPNVVLTPDQRADMVPYMQLAADLSFTSKYMLWCEEENYNHIAYPTYGKSRYPPLLAVILCRVMKWKTGVELMQRRASTPELLYEDAQRAYDSFSVKLGDRKFFFGDSPTEVDALLFGHLIFVERADLPRNLLKPMVAKHQNLAQYRARMADLFFP